MASTVAHIPPPQDNSEIPDQQCAAGSLLVRVQDNMGDTRLVSRSNFIPPPRFKTRLFPSARILGLLLPPDPSKLPLNDLPSGVKWVG
jgi:hypothetical protein